MTATRVSTCGKKKSLILATLILGCGFFSASHAAAPANDRYIDVKAGSSLTGDINTATTSISGGYLFSTSAVTNEATYDANEPYPTCASGGGSRTVWYKYLSTTTLSMEAATIGSDYDTVIQLRRAGSPDNITNLNAEICNDWGAFYDSFHSAKVTAQLLKGVTYYFQVAHYYSDGSGGSNLVFSATMTPVASDEIPPAAYIYYPSSGSFPTLSYLGTISGTASDNVSIQQVEVRISSGEAATKYWDGASWGVSANFLSAYTYNPGGTSSMWEYYASAVTLLPAVTHFIEVRTRDASGNYSGVVVSSFVYNAPQAPSNDSFLTPSTVAVNSFPFSFSGNNSMAQSSPDRTPSCGTYSPPFRDPNRDIWFFIAPSTGGRVIEADTLGSSFETILAIYSSTGGSPSFQSVPMSTGEVTCNVDYYGTKSRIEAALQPNVTYFIQVLNRNSYSSGGNYNLYIINKEVDIIPPASITNLRGYTNYTYGSVELRWTAPGDDGTEPGTISSFQIFWSTHGIANINVSTWPSAGSFFAPMPAGSQEIRSIFGLPQRTTAWFIIKTLDDSYNASLSNAATFYTSGPPPTASNLNHVDASTIAAVPFSAELSASFTDLIIAGDLAPACKMIPPTTNADVWYKYVSTASGISLVANTFNSNIDTVLQVWQDTGGYTVKDQFVPIGCNDDEYGFGQQSKVFLPNLTMGGTYFIQIAYNAAGTLRLQLAQSDSAKPGQITSLSASQGTDNGEVRLSWIEPADNGNDAASGTVNRYFVRYSSLNSINNSNWSNSFTSSGSVLDIETNPLYLIPPTPVAVGSLMNYTIRNLQQGVTYYFAVKSQDQAGNISNTSNSPFAPAKAPALQAGDGGGTAQLRGEDGNSVLTSVPVSSQVTVNIRFTVGPSSITAGGKIVIRFPDYWSSPHFGSPSNPGFITISSITPSVNISTISYGIDIYTEPGVSKLILTAGNRLNAGDIINIRYQNAWTPYNKQNGVQFQVKTQAGASGLLTPIASQPSLNIVAGAPTNLGFLDWNYITLGSGQNSPGIKIEPKDGAWQAATAHKDLKMRVFALYQDSVTYQYRFDNNAQFSKDNFTSDVYFSSGNVANTMTMATAAVNVAQWNPTLSNSAAHATYYNFAIPNGSAGEQIYYRSATIGNTFLWIEYNNDFDMGSSTFTTSRGFQIRSAAVGFNGMTLSPATITPDGDNSADFATINFTPTVSDAQWRIRIGSDPIISQLSPLPNTVGAGGFGGAAVAVSVSSINVFMDYWGTGQPQNISWYGMDFNGNILPNGTYIVRVEDVGGVSISTATLTLNSSFINVFVKRPDTTGAPNAYVSANGSSGQGYAYRSKFTDASGRAKIWGLKSGSSYNLSVNYYDSSAGSNLAGTLGNQTAGNSDASVSTITFNQPAQIRIRAVISTDAVQSGYDQWGWLNVSDASGFQIGFGSLRFPSGSTESDSGWSATGYPSSWTVVNVEANKNYKVRAEIAGFGFQEFNIQPAVAGFNDYTLTFARKPRVMGYVILPTTQTYGTWVSVEGTKSGNNYPTAWGGAWIQGNDSGMGRTTGTFVMDVDTGTYNFKARAFGLGTTVHNSVSVPLAGIGELLTGDVWNGNAVIANGLEFRFSTPSAGISGSITVNGDTRGISPFQLQNASFTLYVNAFSPTNYSYSNAQVLIATHATTASNTFSIPGLEDGLYQINTYLDGFEIDPPGPKTVHVVNGTGSLNLTLKQNTGQIRGFFNIDPNTDFQNISFSMAGPSGSSNTLSVQAFPAMGASTGTWVFPKLGTGFYDVLAFYKTTGQSKSLKVNVVNSQTSTTSFNLNGQVFSVTGTVTVQPFTFGTTVASTGTRIDTVSALVSRTGFENVNIGTGSYNVPIVRIEAYPRDIANFSRGIGNFVNMGSGSGINAGGFGTSGNFGFGQLRYSGVTTSGTWRIDNLPPGVYALRHPVNLDPGAAYYNGTFGSNYETNGSDVANEEKIILIKDNGAMEVLDPQGGNLEFTYTAGSEISGSILLPSDIPSDTRYLTVMVLNKRKEIVSWQWVYLNGNSASYRVTNLASGEYTIIVQDERKGNQTNPDQFAMGANMRKYVAKPLGVTVTGGNLTAQNIQLSRTGYIEGKLAIVRISSSGTKSTELITSNNITLLPEAFKIFSFVPFSRDTNFGGETSQTCSGMGGGPGNCTLNIDSTKGTFLISGLYPDTELRVFFGSQSFEAKSSGQGKLNVIPIEKSGIVVSAGQTLDLGTIELQLGLSLTGSVVDVNNNPVANVRLRATPSGQAVKHDGVPAFSDSKGSFTITGIDPNYRYYDVIVAERDREDQFIYSANVETRYAQKIVKNIEVRKASNPINVTLELGLGSVSGQVTTIDGRQVRIPFGEQFGFPGAVVLAQKRGEIPIKNPIGDIEILSDSNGNYLIPRLSTGTYDIYAISLDYAVKKTSVTVGSSGVTNNIVLSTGLVLSGTIRKPDGTKPLEDTDVSEIIAASNDFSELVIGNKRKEGSTGAVDGYSLGGLKSGTTYTIMFFNHDDEIIVPPENGSGVSITTDTSNFNLTFAQSAPKVFLKGRKTGTKVGGLDQHRFEFNCSQALRNKTLDEKSDAYWQQVVTIESSVGGAGTLAADPEDTNPINPTRKKVSLLYVPASNTTKIVLKFQSYTDQLMPGSSNYYLATSTFAYFLGLDGQLVSSVNNLNGKVLGLENDNSSFQIQPGSFQSSTGTLLASTASVSVELQSADVSIGTSVVTAAPSFGEVESDLPPILSRAVDAMRDIRAKEAAKVQEQAAKSGIKAAGALTAAEVANNVLGKFYDIFLPAGVNRTLAQNARVALAYSTSVTDTSGINVYFYNDSASTVTTTNGDSVPPGAYGIETGSRTIDTDNRTISVSVNHFTVYVVVNATSTVLGSGVTVNAGGGASGTFTKGQVNIINLTAGTTFTLNAIPVSGGLDENHQFTLISTGSGNSGIIMNVQSHLQTLNVAVNQESLIDLNDDGLKDISLVVAGIAGNIATVRIAAQLGLTLLEGADYTGTEILAFNFPNPFDPTRQGFLFTANKAAGGPASASITGATAIRYALPSNLGAGTVGVTLEIFDVSGEVVRKLDFGARATGKYHYGDWDGKNEGGSIVASGVYIGRLAINGAGKSKIFKMAVVK